jgi:hypothetical protein
VVTYIDDFLIVGKEEVARKILNAIRAIWTTSRPRSFCVRRK